MFNSIRITWRLYRILVQISRFGFGYLFERSHLLRFLPFFHRYGTKHRGKTAPERFRLLLTKLGPVFVKFGQILSTRYDLLPPEYIKELEKLQYQVPSFSYEEMQDVFHRNFHQSAESLFKHFSRKPFASASLGQVYKAQLKSGEEVAVKVQRPDLRRQIELDTSVLSVLIDLVDHYVESWRDFNLKGVIEEFRRWTLNEIDYRKEASNCEVFHNLFSGSKSIFSPKIYWDFTTAEILTHEYIDGYCLRDVIEDNLPKEVLKEINKKTLAHHFGDAFIKQYFEFGFFHADPHPGNIYIVDNHKIKFLDFGMVGVLDNRLTSIAAGIFLSLLQKNSEDIVNYMMELENDYNDGEDWEGKVKMGNLRREVNSLVLQWSNNGRPGQFTKLYYDLVNTAVKNGISVPVDLIMLIKSILTIDVIVEKLDSKFRLEDWEDEMTKQILENKLKSWDRSRLQNLLIFGDNFLKNMPEAIPKIIKQLEHLGKKKENNNEVSKYARALYWHARINSYGLVILMAVIVYLLFFR